MHPTRLTLSLLLVASVSHARPPSHSRAGGLPACEARLDTCDADLDQCDADFNAYADACDAEVGALQTTLSEVAVAAPGRAALVRSEDGLTTVSVSPLAVTQPTPITLEPALDAPADDRIRSRAYELGPHGQTFDADVTLCMTVERGSADDTDTDDLCLGYVDDTGRWVCEDPCLEETGDGQVCGKTDHFTNFALLLGGSGGDQTCGDDDGDDWISPAVGGLVSSRTGAATVRIPAGATASDTPVRFTLERLKPTGPDPRRVSDVYELGPDGAVFDRSVEICLDAGAVSPEDVCLAYLDESGGRLQWRCEDRCVEEKNGQVCGQTSHFTSFAVLLDGASSCGDDDVRPGDTVTPGDAATPSDPATPDAGPTGPADPLPAR